MDRILPNKDKIRNIGYVRTNEEWRISRDKNKIRKGIEDMKRQEQEEE